MSAIHSASLVLTLDHCNSQYQCPSLLSNLHCLSTSSVLSKINSLYIFGQLVPLVLDVKNDVLARITEPSNDDYDNGVSDNCDHNFGTFDDFGVKKKKYHIT